MLLFNFCVVKFILLHLTYYCTNIWDQFLKSFNIVITCNKMIKFKYLEQVLITFYHMKKKKNTFLSDHNLKSFLLL